MFLGLSIWIVTSTDSTELAYILVGAAVYESIVLFGEVYHVKGILQFGLAVRIIFAVPLIIATLGRGLRGIWVMVTYLNKQASMIDAFKESTRDLVAEQDSKLAQKPDSEPSIAQTTDNLELQPDVGAHGSDQLIVPISS